jgi:hypothetical protein
MNAFRNHSKEYKVRKQHEDFKIILFQTWEQFVTQQRADTSGSSNLISYVNDEAETMFGIRSPE